MAALERMCECKQRTRFVLQAVFDMCHFRGKMSLPIVKTTQFFKSTVNKFNRYITKIHTRNNLPLTVARIGADDMGLRPPFLSRFSCKICKHSSVSWHFNWRWRSDQGASIGRTAAQSYFPCAHCTGNATNAPHDSQVRSHCCGLLVTAPSLSLSLSHPAGRERRRRCCS